MPAIGLKSIVQTTFEAVILRKGLNPPFLGETKSPFLRKVLERRGMNDDKVTSLLIVERHQRQTPR